MDADASTDAGNALVPLLITTTPLFATTRGRAARMRPWGGALGAAELLRLIDEQLPTGAGAALQESV